MCANTHIATTWVKSYKTNPPTEYRVDTNSYFCGSPENTLVIKKPSDDEFEHIEFWLHSYAADLELLLIHWRVCQHLEICKDPQNCEVLSTIAYPGDCV